MSITPSNASNSIKDIQGCLSSVQSWMSANKLKLNPDKTEFIVFREQKQQAELALFFPADILAIDLYLLTQLKTWVLNLTHALIIMSKQISIIISSCYYHIEYLRRIRCHFTKSVAITLCNALVGSKIDYCNSLYYGINDKQMQHLQVVQNTLCRIMTRAHRFSSITGPLMSLHWFPVKSPLQFKLGLITYKVYKNKFPAYLDNYVQSYRSIYHTRLSEPARYMLSIPHYNYKQHKSFTHLSNSFFSPIEFHDYGTYFLKLVDVLLH